MPERTAAEHWALSGILVASLLTVIAGAGCTRAPSAPAAAPQTPASTLSAADTSTPAADTTVTFAVIGDYGWDDSHERAVATLVASWHPAFVIATGDDYYSHAGGTGTGKYDESTGQYYGKWLKDISTTGHRLPVGPASVNGFFPALGNHDLSDAGIRTYLKYFTLPGAGIPNTSRNERYYDFVEGPVHFFVLDSNEQQIRGTSSTSTQALWLKAQLAASTSTWNVVYDHHPPYSSDSTHGNSPYMRWPFAQWGADAVISGHAHVYERIMRNGIPYFINGLGGAPRYAFGKTPVAGSKVRYRGNWGAQKVVATTTTLDFDFRSVGGRHVDNFALTATPPAGS